MHFPDGKRISLARTSSSFIQKQKEPIRVYPEGLKKSAMTYFPAEQYHRQHRLNC